VEDSVDTGMTRECQCLACRTSVDAQVETLYAAILSWSMKSLRRDVVPQRVNVNLNLCGTDGGAENIPVRFAFGLPASLRVSMDPDVTWPSIVCPGKVIGDDLMAEIVEVLTWNAALCFRI